MILVFKSTAWVDQSAVHFHSMLCSINMLMTNFELGLRHYQNLYNLRSIAPVNFK